MIKLEINSNIKIEILKSGMSLEDLEQQLVSSRKVREFLKHFSETQWSRVVKASVIMGIQELEKN